VKGDIRSVDCNPLKELIFLALHCTQTLIKELFFGGG
jgi:hypothetical protein